MGEETDVRNSGIRIEKTRIVWKYHRHRRRDRHRKNRIGRRNKILLSWIVPEAENSGRFNDGIYIYILYTRKRDVLSLRLKRYTNNY